MYLTLLSRYDLMRNMDMDGVTAGYTNNKT